MFLHICVKFLFKSNVLTHILNVYTYAYVLNKALDILIFS